MDNQFFYLCFASLTLPRSATNASMKSNASGTSFKATLSRRSSIVMNRVGKKISGDKLAVRT